MSERSKMEPLLGIGSVALMKRHLDWQGTTGPGFSLQEPDWPQGDLAVSLAATVLLAIPDGWAKIDGKWVQIRPQSIGKDGEHLVNPIVWLISPNSENWEEDQP